MANTQYYIYAAIAFVVYYIVNTYLTWKRLSHIPGPRWAAFSRWSMYRGQMAGENHQRLYKLSQDYGKLVRIGPNNLMTADAELFKRMNAVRSPYRRGGWYSAMRMKPGADNILSAKSEEHHDRLRQKMFNGYHGKENPHIEEHIDTRIADWINLIERKYITQGTNLKAMDFARKTQFLTLDVISDVAFNAPFYDLRDDNDNFGYLETTEMVLPGIMFMTIFPGIYEWMEKLYVMDLLAPSAKDKAGLGKVIGIAAEVVKKRFSPEEQKKEHLDMLGSFVRHGLTQEEAESECVFQILAGSDTTATAIRAIMLNLLTNPPVLKKLIDEIDAGIRSGDISSPIKDAEGKELKYLQAIIKEGLRVFPPVTGLIEKCSPPEGDHWNGVFIPGGTAVGYVISPQPVLDTIDC